MIHQQRTAMNIRMSRVHRRRDVINDSYSYEVARELGLGVREEQHAQGEQSETDTKFDATSNNHINWIDFWNRARIYPEQTVAYPDASEYVSSRQRQRPGLQRRRANAFVPDTDDEDDDDSELNSEVDVVIQ
jgi:hypothetical protein